MDEVIRICAKYLIVVPVLVNLYIFWKLKTEKRKQMLMLLIIGGILALLTAKIGSSLFSDPRPFIKDGSSPLVKSSTDNGFPSDHTLLAAFLAFSAYIYNRRLAQALIVVAILVAWGRVAAHVHHLVDTLGSFVIAAASVYIISSVVLPRFRTKDNE